MNNYEDLLNRIHLNSSDNHICNYILCKQFESGYSTLGLVFKSLQKTKTVNEAYDLIISALYFMDISIHQRNGVCPKTIYENNKNQLSQERLYYVKIYKICTDENLILFMKDIFNETVASITCEKFFEMVSKSSIEFDDVLLKKVNIFFQKNLGISFQDTVEMDGKRLRNFSLNNTITEYYQINEKRDNFCLIFNDKNRKGSQKDVEKIEGTFNTIKGFKVQTKEISTKEKLLSDLDEYSKLIAEASDMIVCFFMAHGDEGLVYDQGEISIPLTDILELFSTQKVPYLDGKPKIFVFQSCRGKKLQKLLQFDSPSENGVESNINNTKSQRIQLSKYRDTFIVYSTIFGHYSMRDKVSGSWFINVLCDIIRENSKRFDLDEICTLVNTQYEKICFKNQLISQLCEVSKSTKNQIYLEKPN